MQNKLFFTAVTMFIFSFFIPGIGNIPDAFDARVFAKWVLGLIGLFGLMMLAPEIEEDDLNKNFSIVKISSMVSGLFIAIFGFFGWNQGLFEFPFGWNMLHIVYLSSALMLASLLTAFVIDRYFSEDQKWKKFFHWLYLFATWLKKKTCLHPIENVTEGWLVQDVRWRKCEDCGEDEISDPHVQTNAGFKVLKKCNPKYRPQVA